MIHCHYGAWNGPPRQMSSNMCLGSELHRGGGPLGDGQVGHTVAQSLAPHPDVDRPSSLRLIVNMAASFSL